MPPNHRLANPFGLGQIGVVNAIVNTAAERKADPVPIGAHGHAGLKRTRLGGTIERAVPLAPCPVLIVRE